MRPARTLLFVCSFVFFFGQPVHGCERAAGIVAFTKHDGRTLLLIADHKMRSKRGWAAFGGCAKPEETLAEAAAREFREETRCAFAPVSVRPDTPQVTRGRFTSYALEVNFIEHEQISGLDPKDECADLVFRERGPWLWVDHEALLEALKNNDDGPIPLPSNFPIDPERRWFWRRSAEVIRALNELKAFE